MAGNFVRKNYFSLDIMKFICAILIFLAHYDSEIGKLANPYGYVFSVYIIAVPFFFCCSGFLFFKKFYQLNSFDKREYLKLYIKRILIIYLSWSALYLTLRIISRIMSGTLSEELPKMIHTSLVYTTYETIWFLPALAVAVLLCCLILKKCNIKVLLIISMLLYIIGSFGQTYYNISNSVPIVNEFYKYYNLIFITTRNGVFNGVPFVAMGALLAQSKNNDNEQKYLFKNLILTCIFGVLFIAESLFAKFYTDCYALDFIFMLVPFIYFLMKLLLCIDLKEKKVYFSIRKLSILIFLSQRLFLTAIPALIPSTVYTAITDNYLIGLLIPLSLTFVTSILIMQLSKKYKFFRGLY